jgi:hypothetical protein
MMPPPLRLSVSGLAPGINGTAAGTANELERFVGKLGQLDIGWFDLMFFHLAFPLSGPLSSPMLRRSEGVLNQIRVSDEAW